MNKIEPLRVVGNVKKVSYMNFIQRHWRWIAALCILILILPFFTPAGYFFWGISSAKSLFHDELGIGESISTVFAVAFMFVYTLAIPYAARWLTIGRRRPSDIGIAFLSVLFVFGSKPLLTGILGSSFNAQTGAAQKCYSWRGGALTLSEKGSSGCGIDPITGKQTFEVTPDIAAILERQQHVPKLITTDGTPIQFFDPTSGRPTVWYDHAPDGNLELFDADGFNPNTGKKLIAITPDIAATVHTTIPPRNAPATTTASVGTQLQYVTAPPSVSNHWSEIVNIPAGFTICRDAEYGAGSFDAQVRSGFEVWSPAGIGSAGNAERCRSKGKRQRIGYHFASTGASC